MKTTHYHTEMDSPLGRITLRATKRGLTGIFMENHRHGPDADGFGERRDDHPHLIDAVRQLHEYFAGTRTVFDFPFDLEAAGGTVFQRRVWAALMDIGYGETISYGELARRIGQPAAVRAVGLANGRNPISIVVPCHRVIGANGTLTGYGGGLPNKRTLLDLETRFRPGPRSIPDQAELSLSAV